MVFNAYGNYQAGVHSSNIKEIKKLFVDNFCDSNSREKIYNGLLSFLNTDIFRNNQEMFTKMWIDGSFVTKKQNPNDIDIIMFINPLKNMAKANALMNDYHQNLKPQGIEKSYYSDIYIIVDIDSLPVPDGSNPHYLQYYQESDMQMKYWLGQFTFDRNRNPKGIFELTYEEGEFKNE